MVDVGILDKDHEFVRSAKLGNATDIAIYHYTTGNGVRMNFIDPKLYPERIKPLSKTLGYSDVIVVVVNELDKYTGELILSAGLSGKPVLIYSETFSEEDLRPYLSEINKRMFYSDKFEMFAYLEKLHESITNQDTEQLNVIVDQVLQVRSVGVVLLGSVKSGTVKVHDRLHLYPTNELTTIRSIQVHDNDVPEASAGSRVGLAIKSSYEKVKDTTIAIDPDVTVELTSQVNGILKITKYYNRDMKEKQSLMFGYDLNFVSGQFAKIKTLEQSGKYETVISFEKPIYLTDKTAELLVYDVNAFPRIVGKFVINRS